MFDLEVYIVLFIFCLNIILNYAGLPMLMGGVSFISLTPAVEIPQVIPDNINIAPTDAD